MAEMVARETLKTVDVIELCHRYTNNGDLTHKTLDGVSLSLEAGELVSLIGPNGAGKTTLLKCLAGLLTPDAGQILYDGREDVLSDSYKRAKMIAYLPQFQALHWPVLARELVALGRLPHGESFQARQNDEIKIYEAMQRCGADAFADKSVLSLSGGEQAMILMARLLATDADVLLVDEPFTSLDPERQLHLSALLQEEVHRGKLVVTIVHDLTLAARLSDRLVLMNKGRVEAMGNPENVLSEKNLSSVFNVNAEFGRTDKGPYIIPSIKVTGDEKNVAG